MTLKIGNRIIGDGKTFVIAEMAWSHDGSSDIAKKIIDAAAEAKADAINMHVTFLSEYMIRSYGAGKGRLSAGKDDSDVYKYLDKINPSFDMLQELIAYAKKKGLLISLLCNDMRSVDFAAQHADIFQIHSGTMLEEDLVRKVASQKKPIVLKVGGAYLGEIEKSLSWIKEEGNNSIILMYGFQNYPTRLETIHLNFIKTLQETFGLHVGFADHTDGSTEIAVIIPLVGIAKGATVIEKHLTHDREKKCEDFESALNPDAFAKMMQFIREMESSFGSSSMRAFSADELNYRQVSKKRVVAKAAMRKGSVLTKDMLICKRSDEGVYPDEIKMLLGRTLKLDREPDDPITWETLM